VTRIGFLVPPGNPTVEPEMTRLAPKGVTVHFTRMVAHGEAGSHRGQEERNRSQIAHLDENVALLAMVKPAVIAMAHTAMSTTLGRQAERELVERLERSSGIPFITAFGSVLLALAHLGVRRVALATPYSAEATQKTKAHLEAHGLSVPSFGNLDDVKNIYEETPERAYALACDLGGVGDDVERAASRCSRHSGRDPGPRLRVAPFRRARQTLTACAARSSSSQRFAGSRRNTVSSGTSSLSHRPRFSSSASSPGRQSTSPA